MNCDRCGKDMTDKDGTSLIGMVIDTKGNEENKEFLKRQLGKYESDRKYKFCFECFLDCLFGRSL